ncbi:MAG: hypothetical protein CR979_02640, partial [Propionibacterium sp.]
MAAVNVLAMDAGQTGVRARIVSAGNKISEIQCAGVLSDRPVVPQLAAIVSQVEIPTNTVLAVGSSGLADDVKAADLLALVQKFGITKVLLTHDSVTSYLGALGDEPGAVVASGTGVVTLALGEKSMTRVDGWGYILGDAGSGFWIGRAGFDAVLR